MLRALSRGYAAVAVSSANRRSRCWSIGDPQVDLLPVASALHALRARELGWAAAPLYALGASSGRRARGWATFGGHRGLRVQIHALCTLGGARRSVRVDGRRSGSARR